MSSFEKTRYAEMEAGLPLDQHNGAAAEKGQDHPSASSQPASRPQMSPRRRFFVILFLSSFVGFTVLRGIALMTILCRHGHLQLGIHGEMLEDEAISNSLEPVSLEELCKVYPEYCPEEMRTSTDDFDESETEPAASGMLGKRQDGSNSTGSAATPSGSEVTSSVSNPPTSSSEVPTSSSEIPSSSELPSSSSLPPISSSQAPSTSETTTSESSTAIQTSTTVATTSSGQASSSAGTSSVESTSERPASSSGAEETTSSRASSSGRRTVTSGTVSTSSAERHVLTTTLPDGAPTTLTSTSWVEYVPAAPTGSQDDPELQGSASSWQRSTLLQIAMGVLVGGVLMV